MAAAAAAAAADQSGLYAYIMQASLLNAAAHQYAGPYSHPLLAAGSPHHHSSLSSSAASSSTVALAAAAALQSAAAASPLSYLTAAPLSAVTAGLPVMPPLFPALSACGDRALACCRESGLDLEGSAIQSLMTARQKALLATAAETTSTKHGAPCTPVPTVSLQSASTSFFRPYQPLAVGVASD